MEERRTSENRQLKILFAQTKLFLLVAKAAETSVRAKDVDAILAGHVKLPSFPLN